MFEDSPVVKAPCAARLFFGLCLRRSVARRCGGVAHGEEEQSEGVHIAAHAFTGAVRHPAEQTPGAR